MIFITITAVVGTTVWMGSASDQPLPVIASIDQQMVQVPDGSGATLTDVIVLKNLSGDSLPKIDISINKQYFLYRDSPLEPHEELVLPQSIFSTKSSIRFNPDNYPITLITVTGRLPSGARGVYEVVIGDAASHAVEE